jgi:DNA-binding response OmpR family regulator
MQTANILIVDDDKNICTLIDLYLSNEGYKTTCCYDGTSALDLIERVSFDLVILDLMLPIINGWEVCKLIKMKHDIPILMVSARDLVDDKVSAFDAGGDDYIVKPFEPKELVARVKVRLKNKDLQKLKVYEDTIILGNLKVDMKSYEVRVDGNLIDLKPKETQLLFFLLQNKGIVFTRDQLLKELWDYSYCGDTRTVDVHIKCLREKLMSPNNNWSIKTIWSVGYKFEVQDV